MTEQQQQRRRRRFDLVGLIFGFLFLTVAIGALAGDPMWAVSRGGVWVVTGLIAVLGLGLLVSTLPRKP